MLMMLMLVSESMKERSDGFYGLIDVHHVHLVYIKSVIQRQNHKDVDLKP